MTPAGRDLLRRIGDAEAAGAPLAEHAIDGRILAGLRELVHYVPRYLPSGRSSVSDAVCLTPAGQDAYREMTS